MLSVNPKGHMAGTVSVRPKSALHCDPSDNHPKSRTWHPFSDKILESAFKRSDDKFNLKCELARNDRVNRKLSIMKRKGKVIYG